MVGQSCGLSVLLPHVRSKFIHQAEKSWKVARKPRHDTNHTIAMLTLVPSLSLSAMVSTSSTAGNALLNGRAAGSVGTPAVAFYDAGERPTWPALLARGGTGVNMAASDVAEITPDALVADPMFFDESKAIAELGFAISEEELLLKAKEYLYYGQGVARPELLASDFVFMGPFVGGAGGPPIAC